MSQADPSKPSLTKEQAKRIDDANELRERVYLEALYKAYFESSAQFDRTIELISTGALLISFAYMGEVVPYEKAKCKLWLFWSWVLLISTIMVALISHSHAAACHKRAINDIDRAESRSRSYVSILNSLSIGLLTLGLVGMFAYTAMNLNRE